MNRRNRYWFALVVGLALAVALFWESSRRREETGEPAPASTNGPAPPLRHPAASEAADPQPRRAGAPKATAAKHEVASADEAAADSPLPGSLRDTVPPDVIKTDWRGRLVPTPDIITLFDYFLSATGEEPEEVIKARILRHLRATLPEGAAAEVAKILDDYLDLRHALRDLTEQGLAPATPEERWKWLHDRRREYLGADMAEALFGEQERVAFVDLERWKAAHDDSLGEEERRKRFAELDEQLPAEVAEARREAAAPLEGHREVDELRARGASEEEIFAVREKRFGAEAAQRLADLDRRRTEWNRRLAQYRGERDALLADAPAQDRSAALESLRAKLFAEDELPRVRALDGADGGAQ